jgi:hypothetical protein
MPSPTGQTPLAIAEAGGRHAGFLRQHLQRTAAELQRESQSLRKRAREHRVKITQRVGYNKVSDDPSIQAQADAGRTRHLEKEIDNFTQQAEFCDELAQRLAGGPP